MSRNRYSINGEKIERNKVNLEYWKRSTNIGDLLAPVIYNWMLSRQGLDADAGINRTVHLLTLGSILAEGRIPVDATVWGTGLHHFSGIAKLARYSKIVKLDIRALRGPVTAYALKFCGYPFPEIYGDPAILMPLIHPCAKEEKYEYTVIRHFKSAGQPQVENVHYLDTRTDDIDFFIREICSSRLVISSSLHGIILAESYGIPAVFLQENMEEELIKYHDWYYSTKRNKIRFAYSIDEALRTDPMPTPYLDDMRKGLMDSFPYDLWKQHC